MSDFINNPSKEELKANVELALTIESYKDWTRCSHKTRCLQFPRVWKVGRYDCFC